MTENEIEKIYERTMDKLDHELMNALIAEDEYNQQVAELDKWVDEMCTTLTDVRYFEGV
jgi:ribosome recycling factor